jgi:isopentenyl diphosphate isomerase/L-lactate dehydrogenase-like FMN-dependent dehydrogenase
MQLSELYEIGKSRMSQQEYGRLLGFVETGFIEHNDRRELDRFTFRQRCIDAQEASTSCRVLDVDLSSPVVMSAMTMPIPAISENGLLEVARGLQAAGSLMWTGTPLPQNLGEVMSTGVPLVANVKPYRDRSKLEEEIETIVEAGVTWLGLEIDSGQGTKVQDKEMAFDCSPWAQKEIEAIKNKAPMPLVCKGILSREDALKCIDAGADLLVVSHHGGHTLDYMPHPLQVMDEIVQAVNGKVPLMIDGGFRRGSDVLKGLASGADLVGLGRPILYGLAADGENGVRDVIQGVTRELARLMTMVGASEPAKISPDILIRSRS